MTYFPDLSPYAYGHGSHPGVVHVGWLDGTHSFAQGAVDVSLRGRLRLLAIKPVELYRGYHFCELCAKPGPTKPDMERWFAVTPKSNGEIRLFYGGITFAAPVLIIHYIEEHGYLPPAQFLKAIEEAVC